jgi:hypothetical protein
MTTRNQLDLTDRGAGKALHGFIASNMPFVVLALHHDGYLINAYTARCEQQKDRHALRWHAYKRVGGTLRKRYIGRSEDVTIERLQKIAEHI